MFAIPDIYKIKLKVFKYTKVEKIWNELSIGQNTVTLPLIKNCLFNSWQTKQENNKKRE